MSQNLKALTFLTHAVLELALPVLVRFSMVILIKATSPSWMMSKLKLDMPYFV